VLHKVPTGRSMINTLNFSFNPETTGMSNMFPTAEFMRLLHPLM